MELQTILVQDRIDELARIAGELRAVDAQAGEASSRPQRLAGLRRAAGRRLVILGVALIDSAHPSATRPRVRTPVAPAP